MDAKSDVKSASIFIEHDRGSMGSYALPAEYSVFQVFGLLRFFFCRVAIVSDRPGGFG